MKSSDRIEKFFRKMDDLISFHSVVLWIAIIFIGLGWVFPVWKPAVSMMRDEARIEKKYRNSCPMEDEIKAQGEFSRFVESRYKRAQNIAYHYGPAEYYTDLKYIYEKWWFGKCRPTNFFFAMNPLRAYMWYNINEGHFDRDDEDRRAKEFGRWRDKLDIQRNGSDPFGMENMSGHEILIWAIWFLVGVYWKGLLFSIFVYLVKMNGTFGSGTLRTILASKRKFIFALAAWPHFLWKYPHSNLREIIVRTELQRLGKPLRRLSKSEKELVHRLLNADKRAFKDWRVTFRRDNRENFQRSFAKALLLTLVILVLTPSPTTGSSRRGAVFWESARAGPTISVCIDQVSQQIGSVDIACLPDPVDFVRTTTVIQVVRVENDEALEGPTESIDHVPVLSGYARSIAA